MASCVINVGIFKALNTNRIYTSIDQNYLVDITKIIVLIHSFDIHAIVMILSITKGFFGVKILICLKYIAHYMLNI